LEVGIRRDSPPLLPTLRVVERAGGLHAERSDEGGS